MKEKYLTFVMFVLGCFLTTLMAQTISVKGKVTDDKKTPLPGVSVVVKGTTQGTSTDFDGNYQIQAKAGDVLEFSFVGFTTQTKKVVGGVILIQLMYS
jgi:tonB-dependent receptor plug